VLDSLGSNIVINNKGNNVVRILPRLNEELNEEWITDKARYSFDGLKYQRLTSPLLKNESGEFEEIS
jgi:NADH dehydrogenase (ubiquinone) Fe-S protein 1